jgi:hypothetical protein
MAQTLTVNPQATLLQNPTRVQMTGTYTCDSGSGSVSALLKQGSTFGQGGTQVTCTGSENTYTLIVNGPFTSGSATVTMTLTANAQTTQVKDQAITIS